MPIPQSDFPRHFRRERSQKVVIEVLESQGKGGGVFSNSTTIAFQKKKK